MAIITSDLHCNVEKVERFLKYKPDEQHIFAGDVLDSFDYSFQRAFDSLTMLVDSECTLIWGNHDISYRADKPFNCSGHDYTNQYAFQQYIETNIKRFQIAACADGYLVTHAGLADWILKDVVIDPKLQTIVDYLNTEPKEVFAIGRIRGGYDVVGGPLWFDFRYEAGLSKDFNQIFGHCCLEKPWEDKQDKYHHVCINTYEGAPELYVFNTTTKQIERIDNVE